MGIAESIMRSHAAALGEGDSPAVPPEEYSMASMGWLCEGYRSSSFFTFES